MVRKKLSQNYLPISALITSLFLFAVPASAATIWTDWSSIIGGAPGSASGLLNGVGVSYSGQVNNIWAPGGSFTGGTVTTAPPNSLDDAIFVNGNAQGTNTINFATPVMNPLLAIWSLGSSSLPGALTFKTTPTFEAGGPNDIYGGQAITVSGNTVGGSEGNGVVQFTGNFSTLSWTNTLPNTSPDLYGFTIGQAIPGTAGQAPPGTAGQAPTGTAGQAPGLAPEINLGAGGAGLTVLAIALLLAGERRSRAS